MLAILYDDFNQKGKNIHDEMDLHHFYKKGGIKISSFYRYIYKCFSFKILQLGVEIILLQTIKICHMLASLIFQTREIKLDMVGFRAFSMVSSSNYQVKSFNCKRRRTTVSMTVRSRWTLQNGTEKSTIKQ